MHKFLAVLKREYKKIVFSWTFMISTIIAPLLMLGLSMVPVLMMSISGKPVRVAFVDQSGRISNRIEMNLSPEKQEEKLKTATSDSAGNLNISQDDRIKKAAETVGVKFEFVGSPNPALPIDEIKSQLSEQIKEDKLDAYLIIPQDYEAKDAKFDFFAKNSSDFVLKEAMENALSDAVRAERLAKANISEETLKSINQKIKFNVTKVSDKGEEKDTGMNFAVGFGLAMIIYLSLTLYGSIIMGAIIEEKETRISEVLFSSAKPFQLMMGKLIGVGLAAMTQVAIWFVSAAIILGYFLTTANFGGETFTFPTISPVLILYFFAFFLLGFFTYATIYAIIGAMVTTSQEAQQFVFIPVIVSLVGLYSTFPVLRDPNSTYSFWASLTPFVSPIVMPVRIFSGNPPSWQIFLSILVNIAVILLTTWVAAKVYRIGMLMYGKRATIPEVWKWIKQS